MADTALSTYNSCPSKLYSIRLGIRRRGGIPNSDLVRGLRCWRFMSNDKTETTTALASAKGNNATKTTTAEPDFGETRYSRIMSIAYKDAIRVIGLEPKQAERYANAFGADLGRAKACPERMADLKFTKVNKDGFTRISESSKSTLVKFSYAMELNRLICGLDDMRGSVEAEAGKPLFEVRLADRLVEWLEKK